MEINSLRLWCSNRTHRFSFSRFIDLNPSTAVLWVVATSFFLSCGGSGDESPSTVSQSLTPVELVSGSKYTKILIEVDWMVGRKPSSSAVTQFTAEVAQLVSDGYIAKSDGVEWVWDDELPSSDDSDTVHTFGHLNSLVNQYRSIEAPDNVAVLYVLFVDGHYEDDEASSSVLGYAYGGDTVVMLKDNIQRSCTTSPLVKLLAPKLADEVCALSESTVLLHEFGHLLGLVNNGLPMVAFHQDKDHGKHDNNEDCIMYWLNERSGVADVIAKKLQAGKSGSLPFDDACLADLAAVSGKK